MKIVLSMYCKASVLCMEGKKRIKHIFKNRSESGMGTVEIIIIIAVLVALALLFKTFIMDLAESIFGKIKSKTDSAIGSL